MNERTRKLMQERTNEWMGEWFTELMTEMTDCLKLINKRVTSLIILIY